MQEIRKIFFSIWLFSISNPFLLLAVEHKLPVKITVLEEIKIEHKLPHLI